MRSFSHQATDGASTSGGKIRSQPLAVRRHPCSKAETPGGLIAGSSDGAGHVAAAMELTITTNANPTRGFMVGVSDSQKSNKGGGLP